MAEEHPTRSSEFGTCRALSKKRQSGHSWNVSGGTIRFILPAELLSGLLSSCFGELKPTVGLVDANEAFQHYEQLGKVGLSGRRTTLR